MILIKHHSNIHGQIANKSLLLSPRIPLTITTGTMTPEICLSAATESVDATFPPWEAASRCHRFLHWCVAVLWKAAAAATMIPYSVVAHRRHRVATEAASAASESMRTLAGTRSTIGDKDCGDLHPPIGTLHTETSCTPLEASATGVYFGPIHTSTRHAEKAWIKTWCSRHRLCSKVSSNR